MAGARCPVWRWCSRSTTPGGRGATSSTPTPGNARAASVGRPRMKSRKDHRQSFRLTRNGFSRPVQWPVVCGEGGRGAGALVARSARASRRAVTIIREPDGHYYASFVVDVAAHTAAARCSGGRGGCGHQRGWRRSRPPTGAHRRCEPEAFGPQAAQVAAVGAGEVPPAERIGTTGTRRGAKWRSRTTRWRGRGGTITTSRLWRWFARTK